MDAITRKHAGLSSTVTVVEHVVLFKFKDGYTDEQENDMYKGLWTFKERFPSIMAMSLGRVLARNADGVTHILVMRFASKEALDTYMDDDWRVEISYKYIVPFFNGELTADFEAEVDIDLSHLYKDSEKFREGVEHIELFKVKEGTPSAQVEEFLNALADLPKNVQTDVVQLTAGTNFKPNEKYTHAAVAVLPSAQALGALIEDPLYQDLLEKLYPFLDDHLRVDFIVDESKKRFDVVGQLNTHGGGRMHSLTGRIKMSGKLYGQPFSIRISATSLYEATLV